jgi:hypothetical protein
MIFGFSTVLPVQSNLSNKPYDAIHKRHIYHQYFSCHPLASIHRYPPSERFTKIVPWQSGYPGTDTEKTVE